MADKTNTINQLVTIIIPCRNEEAFVGACLDSLIAADYPAEKLEVLVVDGESSDKTKEIVENYSKKNYFIKYLSNPKKIASSALNIGVKNAKGEIIIRMDAHASYDRNYISKCVKYLNESGADNVGGVMKTLPSNETVVAKAIALAISSPFGAASQFRVGSDKPVEVDTVFGGCYRKDVFERIGLFNENLNRSQDLELNLRLKKAGGEIILVPDIISYYYPKSNLKDFAIHNFEDGVWAIYPAKFIRMPLKIRHYIPLIFVSTLIITLITGIFYPGFIFLFILEASFYLLANLYFSIKIAIREKTIEYIYILPIVFMIRHLFYGAGSLWGLIKLLK